MNTISIGIGISKVTAVSGGDAEKANVVTNADGKTLTVSDGTTSVSCDANGNCSPL